MPGRAHLSLPGIPWHIIQRGNNRLNIWGQSKNSL